MQPNRLRSWSLALLLLTSLYACQQPTTPTPAVDPLTPVATSPQYRLKTMVRSGSTFYNEYSYAYTTAGQLASYTLRTGLDAGAPSQTTRFTYDQQGKLSTAERLPASSFMSARQTYAYDASGRLTQISIYEAVNQDGQFLLTKTIGFTYETGNRPVQTTLTIGSRVETTKYTYEGENISKSERMVTSSFGTSTETITYRHDTSPNPTYGLLIDTPTVEVFNKNNVVYDGCLLTYTDGLLTMLRADPALAPTSQWQVTYAYEKY